MGALVGAALEVVLEWLLWALLDLLLIGTGEILRFVFTRGRYKPSLSHGKGGSPFSGRCRASLGLGFVFWLAVSACIAVWMFEP